MEIVWRYRFGGPLVYLPARHRFPGRSSLVKVHRSFCIPLIISTVLCHNRWTRLTAAATVCGGKP
eukprot:scaffold5109_cov238-Pinguiococcus_pyrenoidosus.AAC.3